MFRIPVLLLVLLLLATGLHAQDKEKLAGLDSSGKTTTTIETDSSKNGVEKKVRVYSPRKAAIRSAILPGLGQIYNRKYWKVPLVYAALGITGGVFIFNYTSYRDTRFAYKAKYELSVKPLPHTAADSVNYFKIKSPLERYSLETLRYYRDQYRRDIDYSALLFVIFWGLNVVDATVDAHLKAFDVSPDLSLKFKPGKSEMAGTTGVSLIFSVGKNINPRPLLSTFR